jgi:hypothetical protein
LKGQKGYLRKFINFMECLEYLELGGRKMVAHKDDKGHEEGMEVHKVT